MATSVNSVDDAKDTDKATPTYIIHIFSVIITFGSLFFFSKRITKCDWMTPSTADMFDLRYHVLFFCYLLQMFVGVIKLLQDI